MSLLTGPTLLNPLAGTLSPTIITPTLNGVPVGTGVATAATVSTLALRDANGNVTTVNLLESLTSTATAAGTTTFTVSSNYQQLFTGSTTQTVTLPVASTLVVGQSWQVINTSTGAVTVQSSGSNSVIVLAAGTVATVTCIQASGTGTASWQTNYQGVIVTSGKSLSISNTLTLAGTDATTLTFQGTDTYVGRATTDTLTNKTLTTPTLTTPAINGPSTGTGVAIAATANTLTLRDANGNVTTVNLLESLTSTATAAGTTTLTVSSNYQQLFTGTSTQTVTLPVASTLVVGQSWQIVNASTGAVTVQSSGSNSVIVLAASTMATVTCIQASGTGTASWQVFYNGMIVTSGKSLSVSNTLTFAGTDGTTQTFQASDTIVGRATTDTLTNKTITAASNTITLTGIVPYDLSVVGFAKGTTRAAGTGDFPMGIKLQRAVTFTSVTYRANTADASGNLVVKLQKNASDTGMTGSSVTIAAASQVAGGTGTGTWSFSAGDTLTVDVVSVGTTPGTGLIADITGLA